MTDQPIAPKPTGYGVRDAEWCACEKYTIEPPHRVCPVCLDKAKPAKTPAEFIARVDKAVEEREAG